MLGNKHLRFIFSYLSQNYDPQLKSLLEHCFILDVKSIFLLFGNAVGKIEYCKAEL